MTGIKRVSLLHSSCISLLTNLLIDFLLIGIFLNNAITYSAPDTEILLKAESNKNNLIFSIIDHGQGITAENKPYIFDRFYYTDKSRTQKEHYGLGLSIAKEPVAMHKGTITLSDTLEGGCTFRISFPYIFH